MTTVPAMFAESRLQAVYYAFRRQLTPDAWNCCRHIAWSIRRRMDATLGYLGGETRLIKEAKLLIDRYPISFLHADRDIEMLVFLVMMEAARNENQYLDVLMRELQHDNRLKKLLIDSMISAETAVNARTNLGAHGKYYLVGASHGYGHHASQSGGFGASNHRPRGRS